MHRVNISFELNLITNLLNVLSDAEKKLINKSCKSIKYATNTDKVLIFFSYHNVKKYIPEIFNITDPVNFYLNNIVLKNLKKNKLFNMLYISLYYIILNPTIFETINNIGQNDIPVSILIKSKRKQVATIHLILQNLIIKKKNSDSCCTFSEDEDEDINFLIIIDNIEIDEKFNNCCPIDDPNIELMNVDYIALKDEIIEIKEELDTCTICLEPCSNKTPCNHFIHKKCLLKVTKYKCPICRKKLFSYIKTFLQKSDLISLRYYHYEKKLIEDINANLDVIIGEYLSNYNINSNNFCTMYSNMFYFVMKHNKYNMNAIFDIILKYNLLSHKAFQKISNLQPGMFIYNFNSINTILDYILHIGDLSVIKWVSLHKYLKKNYKSPVYDAFKQVDQNSYLIAISISIGNNKKITKMMFINNEVKKTSGNIKKINFKDKLLSFINLDPNWPQTCKNYLVDHYEYKWAKMEYLNMIA